MLSSPCRFMQSMLMSQVLQLEALQLYYSIAQRFSKSRPQSRGNLIWITSTVTVFDGINFQLWRKPLIMALFKMPFLTLSFSLLCSDVQHQRSGSGVAVIASLCSFCFSQTCLLLQCMFCSASHVSQFKMGCS